MKRKVKKASGPRAAIATPEESGIASIGVEGFKAIRDQMEIAVRPLTILAGANSSGKSSIMQPLLLMKQTLEAPYDPGSLLLDGPHVRFTEARQLFSRFAGRSAESFVITVRTLGQRMVALRFDKEKGESAGLLVAEMAEANPLGYGDVLRLAGFKANRSVFVSRDRCFLKVRRWNDLGKSDEKNGPAAEDLGEYIAVSQVREGLRAILHVPALRGNPERTYKTTAIGGEFPGTFEPYVASVIHHWQARKDVRLRQLGAALSKLGLTWNVAATRIDDTRVELRVPRLKQKTLNGADDLVSIADVGFGISQCLPVLVALLTARPGQLVYIEEPEIHLHPRAQVALAQVLADAANRGVRVIIETHSSLLLLGVQALVAEGALPSELVALHWFSLASDGATQVRSADLDEAGAFGDWPEDFAEVALNAQARYLDAAEKRLAKVKR